MAGKPGAALPPGMVAAEAGPAKSGAAPGGAGAGDGAAGGKGFEPGPGVRAPLAGLAVNGRRFDDLLVEVEVTANSYFHADSFRASLAFDETGDSAGPAFWADTDRLEVEVFAGFADPSAPPGAAPADRSLFAGRVDEVRIDLAGRSVELSGRDFTADLLESKTNEKWANRSSAEIVREIAGRHGLTPVVTDTEGLAGRFYATDHAALTDETPEWNLLTYLAEHEGMVVYVRGRELHFERPAGEGGDAGSAATPARWAIRYEPGGGGTPGGGGGGGPPRAPGVTGLELTRQLTFAKDITVKVESWNAKRKKAFEATARTRRAARSATGQFASATAYVFRAPGLTPEQAQRMAESKLADLTRQERVVSATLPADFGVLVNDAASLSGTGTSFDGQPYRVDEVTWQVSRGQGATMRLTLRNVAPESTSEI